MKNIIKISEDANCNYLAKIVKLKNIRKHKNADRLQIVTIDFQDVVTGLDAKKGDIYCYFPVECKINKDFLSFTNSFRHSDLNAIKEQVGFFEDNCRVRAVKLRGEKSMGYIVPIRNVEQFVGKDLSEFAEMEFDTINDVLMVEKYVVKMRQVQGNEKNGKKPLASRLVDRQVRLHVSTENLRKNALKINPDDYITITYKTHGTSWWVGNLLVKRKLSTVEKVLKYFGIKIDDKEYDHIYGSRKTIRNGCEQICNKYPSNINLWEEIKNELKEFIPKGFTFYGECLGYTKSGKMIQSGYDYGCAEGEKKIQVYRITFTNSDGIVSELSSRQIEELCNRFGLEYVPLLYRGKAKDLYRIGTKRGWHEKFIKKLTEDYNDKNCFICKNKVPEEGIVLRKDSLYEFEAYKLKSFRFLEMETKNLDNNVFDMESDNS